jgi:hypothetical protein
MASKRSKKKPGGKMIIRHGSMLLQSEQPRRIEIHTAPSKKTERQHAKPGAGIKRARAAMLKKPRS